MDQIDWEISAEIAAPNVRAQIRHYHWPTENDILVDRHEYYVSQWLGAGLSFGGSDVRNTESVTPGSCGILPPGVPVRLRMPVGWQEGFMCVIEPAYFERTTDLRGRWNDQAVSTYFNIQNHHLRTAMERIYQELLEPGFASDLVVEAAGNLIMVDLSRYLRRRWGESEGSKSRDRGLAPWQLRRIVERIEASEELGFPTLNELAGGCSLSLFHVMRNFKISTGMTIHQCIEQSRLAAAKQMLLETDLSVKTIAFRLGFSSPAYFSAAFRRLTSVTPSAFRSRKARGG